MTGNQRRRRRDAAAGRSRTVSLGGPPDLRLAGLAVGVWLSALTALHVAAPTAASGAVVAAVGAAMWARLLARTGRGSMRGLRGSMRGRRQRASRTRRPGWAGVSVLLGVACGGAVTAASVVVRDAEPLARLTVDRASVQAELVVRDDPRPVGQGTGRPTVLVSADLTSVQANPSTRSRLHARILVLASNDGWRGLLPGQQVAATGRLSPPRGGDLRAAVLSVTGPPDRLGDPGWAQRAAGDLRAGLQRACAPLPDDPGGLLPGLVVGDTSRLPPAVVEDFRSTGLTHLVAVSGANVAIVVGLVLLLARWAYARPWTAVLAGAFALLGFVILARPSPSVLRAAAMGAIGLLALATGRPHAAVPALGATVSGLVLLDPELAGHAGFALSVLATGGLLLLAPRWRDAMRARGVPSGIAEALAVPAAAQVTCAPVVAAMSGTVSVVAVPANLLAAPAIAPATVLGVVAAAVSPVSPTAAEFLAWLAGWPARWLVSVARFGADVPAGSLPWLPGLAGGLALATVTVALLLASRRRWVRRLAAVVVVAVVLGALPVRLVAPGWPPNGWVLVVCAVGQGDAAVLPAGRHAAVVVDAGAEPASTDRCLRRLGVRRVHLLVITHFHADHVGGIDGIFRGRRIGAVVTTEWPEPVAGRLAVRQAATAAKVEVRRAVSGWSYTDEGLHLAAVGPSRSLRGTRSDPNNNSLVLRATVAGLGVLLPGDAEGEEQRALLRQPWTPPAPVLKLPHHGSIYQDPDFLDIVDPAVVLVSVGADNRYGHPNASVLARLAGSGARIFRTDMDGDIAVIWVDGDMSVVRRGRDVGDRRPASSIG